jgi:hypothetical protein
MGILDDLLDEFIDPEDVKKAAGKVVKKTTDQAKKVNKWIDKLSINDDSDEEMDDLDEEIEEVDDLDEEMDDSDESSINEQKMKRIEKKNEKQQHSTVSNSTSQGIYNKELEKLIEMALMDGVLTEQEKRVLFKKAESLGIDLDEFEMVLEARLYEKQQSDKKMESHVAAVPQSDKVAASKSTGVRKCPACGAILDTFVVRCPACGTELRNIESSQNIVKFFEKLNEFESGRIEDTYSEKKNKTGCFTIILWVFFWYIMLPYKIITLILRTNKPARWTAFDRKKEEFIINYPVPISKEDILEFLALSTSKIENLSYMDLLSEKGKSKNYWNKIWLQKIEQIKIKASLSMKEDRNTCAEISQLGDNAKKIYKKNKAKILHILIISLTLVALFCGLIVYGIYAAEKQEDEQRALVSQIEMYIKNGEIELAQKEISRVDSWNKEDLLEKLQLAELNDKLNKIDSLIVKKNFDKASSDLKKLIWTPADSYIDSGEQELIKSFLRQKTIVNSNLPAKYRIKVESIDKYIKQENK